MDRKHAEDKASRLDLFVLTDANEHINVEIQFSNKYDIIERSIFYWAGIYHASLGKGEEYLKLRPVIVINILNYDMINETNQFHTMFHLRENTEHFKLTNITEFHYIEMTKLIKAWTLGELDPWNDALARWLLLLGMVDARHKKVFEDIYKEMERIALGDEMVRDVFTRWETVSMTDEEYWAYESRLKQVLDEEAYRARIRNMEERLERNTREFENKKQEFESNKKEFESNKQEFESSKQLMEQREQEMLRAEHKIDKAEQKIEKAGHKVQREMQVIQQEKQKMKQEKQDLKLIMEKTAIHLLENGLDIDLVAESTGLSKSEVILLQRK